MTQNLTIRAKRYRKPQRLSLPAPFGSMLKRDFQITLKKERKSEARDPAYLEMIRQCPCLKCGQDPCGEAAHVRMGNAAFGKKNASGKKPEDKWTTPLCRGCHQEDRDSQHKLGEREFWSRIGINPLLVCQRLYAQRGDVVAMRAVAFTAIAERESMAQIGDRETLSSAHREGDCK